MILVFGKSGQLATELQRLPDTLCLGREDADLSQPQVCAAAIRSHEPEAVINAAAYTAVDKAESEEPLATAINADAPGAMAAACAEMGIPLVSVSTDYVFDGSGSAPWKPTDATAPLSAYGRSKLAGERAIAAAGGPHAILRTSWVVSAHGNNFVKTMLRLSRDRDALTIVADQHGAPTPAKALAQACYAAAHTLTTQPEKSGIYHFASTPDTTWADFARAIFAEAGISCTVTDIPTSDYPTPAQRPLNSRLDCASFTAAFGLDRPDWRTPLQDILQDLGRLRLTNRKGIILAGGKGTRLWPITMGVSKQLLPVYDKPMIFYPLSVLMLAGIREIAVITTPQDQDQFQRTLGDGSQWGLELTYINQHSPDGLAQAYILAEDFLDGAPSALVLGDNIFFGHGLPDLMAQAKDTGGTVFGYHVADPERYGVVDFDEDGHVRAIVEKPDNPPSNYAVTGLYFLDGDAPARARQVKPSDRGELEIVSLLEIYRAEGSLKVETMGRGFAWFDTGTHASLLDAGNFVRTLEARQGLQAGCPEEIAFEFGWITADELRERARLFSKNAYGRYLKGLVD